MVETLGISWSGGKDSCYALMLALQGGHQPAALLNMMNENGKISRSHALPVALLQAQSRALQLPLLAIPSSWKEYESNFVTALGSLKKTYGISAMVFGDIDLQEHRDWEEQVCGQAGIRALLPLWQQPRRDLVDRMLAAGMEAVIVSCNPVMGPRFLGRRLDIKLLGELERLGVDPCGENGEFHTLVTHCPVFRQPVELPGGHPRLHEGYWLMDWDPA